jgi:uncharacterized protein (TIGR02145 family)
MFRFYYTCLSCIFLCITVTFSSNLIAQPAILDSEEIIMDVQGNIYPVIQIGSQLWMGANLRTSQFRNGASIPDIYEEGETFIYQYGRLYAWQTVQDAQGLCPSGWGIPRDEDWNQLIEYLDPNAWGNKNRLGILLKSCREIGSGQGQQCNTVEHPRWENSSGRSGVNQIGFSAFPAGYGFEGNINNMGTHGYFWTSTEIDDAHAWAQVLLYSHAGMSRSNYLKKFAFSVRCIKTPEGSTPTVSTLSVTLTGNTDASVTAQVSHDGGSKVSGRGIIWGTSSFISMEAYDHKANSEGGKGDFSILINELLPQTTYYFRAWAHNSQGLALGNIISFTTPAEPALPKVKTSASFEILPYSITGGGDVTDDGNLEILARGLVYGLNSGIDLSSNLGYTVNQRGKGIFTSEIHPLWEETKYYIKAYATNALGTSFGEEVIVQTPDYEHCGVAVDVDGNTYRTVIIGQKCIMRENLRVSRFRNGDAINHVPDNSAWRNTNQPAWVNYDNNPAYDQVYGKLYNWYAVNDSRGLCPVGWRVSSYDDLIHMAEILGGEAVAGGKMKQIFNSSQNAKALWIAPNTAATNESGFTATPHGYRLANGYFSGLANSAYLRTSTASGNNHSYQFYLYYNKESFSGDLFGHNDGDAVRCVKIQ